MGIFNLTPEDYAVVANAAMSAAPAAASQPSFVRGLVSRLAEGVDQDGIAGLLGGLAGKTDSDAYKLTTGLLRGVGRGIGSAYGNPNFALQAQAVETDRAYKDSKLRRQLREDEYLALAAQQNLATPEGRAKAAAYVQAAGKTVGSFYKENEANAPKVAEIGAGDGMKRSVLVKPDGSYTPIGEPFAAFRPSQPKDWIGKGAKVLGTDGKVRWNAPGKPWDGLEAPGDGAGGMTPTVEATAGTRLADYEWLASLPPQQRERELGFQRNPRALNAVKQAPGEPLEAYHARLRRIGALPPAATGNEAADSYLRESGLLP